MQQLEFHGHYSKYRWGILSSPRTVHLLTLTSGPMSWVTMVSQPGSPLLGVGSAVIFFILAGDADAWACHNFFWNETCFPDLLEPIKQHLKNHKNTNNSYLDILYLNKISTVTLVCPKFIYFIFTSHGNYIIILITSNLL
jgi:hypothetical protein